MKRRAQSVLVTVAVLVFALGMLEARAQAQTGAADPDLQFIDEMIVHHQGAIDEAKAIQQKARRAEVKQLSAAIIKAQTAEIAQLRKWRRAWFPSAPQPPAASAGGMSMGGGAIGGMPHGNMPMGGTSSGAVPADPDLAFVESMIPHHGDAVAMSRKILETTKRPEIQQLARTIIRDQEREIAQMETWKRSWGPGRK